MQVRKALLLLFVVTTLAVFTAPALAEHHEGDKGEAKTGEMPPEIAAMLALGAPVEQHEFLEKLEGTWRSESKIWMDPSQPPATSLGRSVNKMIMGGRFLQTEFSGEFMEMPFQGLGLDGYDRVNEKYVSIWLDNTGTMVFSMEGTIDEAKRVRTMWSEYTDPATGQPSKMKTVTILVTDDEHVFESYNQLPDGKFFKTMEIVYKRQ